MALRKAQDKDTVLCTSDGHAKLVSKQAPTPEQCSCWLFDSLGQEIKRANGAGYNLWCCPPRLRQEVVLES
jgi:hypothetical protein